MPGQLIRVLIADNNLELCRTIQEFLDNQGDMEVVGIALDGQQALEQIAERRPDVVILDITKPNLRSEERRVGKECRSRRSPYAHSKNKEQKIGDIHAQHAR